MTSGIRYAGSVVLKDDTEAGSRIIPSEWKASLAHLFARVSHREPSSLTESILNCDPSHI